MRFRATRRGVLAGAAGFVLCGAARAAAPQRIVSLNPCLDAILLEVVDRSRIAALSHYARDAQSSTVAAIAETLPITYETAEEVAALAPDLVLASVHTSIATRNALERLNIPFALFDVPEAIRASLAQVSGVAALCEAESRGRELIAGIEAALTAAEPRTAHPPIEAVVFQARGFAAGEGTLLDEMLRRCGFVNVAARYGIRKWGNVGLESLIADPPQMLLAGQASAGAPTWAERVLSHPALEAIAGRMARATFPEALMYCGGPVLRQTAAALAAARDAYWSARA
ncbi:MAG: ABC transporter substrate-binding protein [Alphaproteobacteria bacterium]|nr:ABC transporter substrate-binding protein [Alphaproteobacteria bacterium]